MKRFSDIDCSETAMEQKRKRGRPKKAIDDSVRRGICVQPKFPRKLHREIHAAAAAEGLAITQWIKRLCYIELAKKTTAPPEA